MKLYQNGDSSCYYHTEERRKEGRKEKEKVEVCSAEAA